MSRQGMGRGAAVICSRWPRWPRGRYNGRRIVGLSVEFSAWINDWRLSAAWNFGNPVLNIGPVRIKGAVVYQHSEGQ